MSAVAVDAAMAGLPFAHADGIDGGMGWGIVMMVGMALFWTALILGVVLLVRQLARGRNGGKPQAHGSEGTIRILERRFAEGEIDAAEYNERRSAIEGPP